LLYVIVSPVNRAKIEGFIDLGRENYAVYMDYNHYLIAAIVLALVFQAWSGPLRPVLRTLIPVAVWILALRIAAPHRAGILPVLPAPFRWHSLGVISVAWITGLAACWISRSFPRFGTRPLVHTGGFLLFVIIASQVAAQSAHAPAARGSEPALGPIWPVVVAGAGFLYVWWLAIITFDLTFVWHLYIRSSGALRYIEERFARATRAGRINVRTVPPHEPV
jgi:hypothetical protein